MKLQNDITGAHNHSLMHLLAVYTTEMQLEVVLLCVVVCIP